MTWPPRPPRFPLPPRIVLFGRERHHRGTVTPDIVNVFAHVADADSLREPEGQLLLGDGAIDLDVVDDVFAKVLRVYGRVGPGSRHPNPARQVDAGRRLLKSTTCLRSWISSGGWPAPFSTRVILSVSIMA